MDFGFNDEQQEIQRTAREFLSARFTPEKVRGLAESRGYDHALWSEICELGWPGIAIDEAHGGQGLAMVELVILCEELGYACAPTPFLSNAAAGLLIDATGTDEQRERWPAAPRRSRRTRRRSCPTPRALQWWCSPRATGYGRSRPPAPRSSPSR